MKNKKIVSIILIMILIPFMVLTSVISNNSWKNSARYETPELALTYDKSVHADEILKVLQCNDVAEIFYVEDGTLLSRKAFKRNNGWMGVSQYTPISKYSKTINKATITYHIQLQKHIITIDALTNEPIEIQDSIHTQIEYYKNEQYYIQSWLIVFDELPDNYYLTINGEKVYLK